MEGQSKVEDEHNGDIEPSVEPNNEEGATLNDISEHNIAPDAQNEQLHTDLDENIDNENDEKHESKENSEPEHPLTDSWTFWYVYSLSHLERK